MKRYKKSAFLLFEVLVAIIIASTVFVIVMQGMGSALRAGSAAEGYFKAMLLAESKIVMLEKKVAWKSEITSGKFTEDEDPEGIFSWEQKITPVITPMWGTITLPVSEAKVTVKWKERRVELVTYVTGYEGTTTER